MFDDIINERRSQGRREDDALQVLLDMGETTPSIIEVGMIRPYTSLILILL